MSIFRRPLEVNRFHVQRQNVHFTSQYLSQIRCCPTKISMNEFFDVCARLRCKQQCEHVHFTWNTNDMKSNMKYVLYTSYVHTFDGKRLHAVDRTASDQQRSPMQNSQRCLLQYCGTYFIASVAKRIDCVQVVLIDGRRWFAIFIFQFDTKSFVSFSFRFLA